MSVQAAWVLMIEVWTNYGLPLIKEKSAYTLIMKTIPAVLFTLHVETSFSRHEAGDVKIKQRPRVLLFLLP